MVFFDLSEILERRLGFQVFALVFDGYSIHNDLHWSFKEEYERRLPLNWTRAEIHLPPSILTGIRAVVCDPKHVAKRVRYQFVCSEFWVGFGTEHIHFSLERIQAAGFLP
jgi:hypothetical protein